MFGDDQVSTWFFHYIELLQDAGFNELATFMAKQCASEEVIRVIQEVTISIFRLILSHFLEHARQILLRQLFDSGA